MTGDDMSELAERLDRIATAVERIAGALEPTVSVSANPFPYERCSSWHRRSPASLQNGCVLPVGHVGKHNSGIAEWMGGA